MRSLISIADLTNDEIEEIFALADSADQLRAGRVGAGQIMATLFYEPSTRTRLSFESAMQRLGGSVISCSDMKASSTAKGETVADTAKVVSSYADVLVVRHHWDGAVQAMAEHADCAGDQRRRRRPRASDPDAVRSLYPAQGEGRSQRLDGSRVRRS